MLVDFLLKNYIVWPWDITSEANQARLRKWWFHLFVDLPVPELQVDDCPTLIGIKLRGLRRESGSLLSKYQCEVLQRCYVLPQTEKRSTLVNVLETLRIFKQESLHSQQFLVRFDFVRAARLCSDVVIEILKYLSLIDSIEAFSVSILPLLQEAHGKFHLVNPSNPLIQIVGEHLDPRKIVSLRITDDCRIPKEDLAISRSFDQLTSVTLLSKRGTHLIDDLRHYLPNVRRLSIWFDNETNPHYFRFPGDLSPAPITHLEIRCPGNCFIYFPIDSGPEHSVVNHTITSFVFDMEYYPRHRASSHRYGNVSDVVHSALEFTRTLANVRRVGFVTNRHQIHNVVRLHQWQWLIAECACLDGVIIQLVDDGDFVQEASDVEQELRQLRPGFMFQIKSA